MTARHLTPVPSPTPHPDLVDALLATVLDQGIAPNELAAPRCRGEVAAAAGVASVEEHDWTRVLDRLDQALAAAARGSSAKAPRCRDCQQPVRWGMTTKGKRLAIDPLPHPMGNVVVATELGGRPRYDVAAHHELPLVGRTAYRPHWATCPSAEANRRDRRPGTPAPRPDGAATPPADNVIPMRAPDTSEAYVRGMTLVVSSRRCIACGYPLAQVIVDRGERLHLFCPDPLASSSPARRSSRSRSSR